MHSPTAAAARNPPIGGGSGIRTDIQSLRGIAVLLVLAYHGRFGLFRNGFLGVDVFFVISGFLIGGMILRDLDAGRFRFREFYWRRARRLLPAAYVVLLLTSLAASALLTPRELVAYAKQLAGALSLTANVVLWRQTGYFEEGVALKTLMHWWSLSLEEQFYLSLPLALWLTPARLRRPAVLLALVVSAAACFALAPRSPSGTFFLLPTRAWELLLGVAGALFFPAQGRAPSGTAARLAANLPVAVIAFLPLTALDPVHPRLDAAIVCAATLVAIRTRSPLLERGALARALSRVGDVSYSLYLVHWPILVFLRVLYLDAVPAHVRALGLLASLLLAAALYRFVENPVRRSGLRPSPARLGLVLAASAAIALVPVLAVLGSRPTPDWAAIRRPNYGLARDCDSGPAFAPTAPCRTADDPKVLVWGDSFAMHLVPGLVVSDRGLGLLQATRSECGPTLDVAPVVGGNVASARDCLAFNRSVIDFVRRASHLEHAVLASSFELYVEPDALLLTPEGVTAARTDAVAAGLARAVAALRSAGARVTVVGAPPTVGADLGSCVERTRTGLPVLGNALLADCAIDARVYRQRRRGEIDVVRSAVESAGANVVWMSDLLCDGARCRTEEGATPLYLDSGHLTYAGSRLLGRKYDLLARVAGLSR